MPDFFAIVIGLLLVAAPCWVLGWHYGVKSFRNRNKAMIQAIKDHNKKYVKWAESPEGTNWEAGYQAGIKATLDTLDAFLERASD